MTDICRDFTSLIIDTEGKVRAERLLEIAVAMSPTSTPCNSNRSTTATASHSTSGNNSRQGSPIMRRAKVMRSRSPVLSRTRRREQQSPEYVCDGIGERRQSSEDTIDDGVRTRLQSPDINPGTGTRDMVDVRLSPEAGGMGEKQQSPDTDVEQQGPESDDRAKSRQESPNPSDCLERKQNPESRERILSRQQSPDIMEGVTVRQQSPDSLERVLVRQCRDVESLAALVEMLPLLVKAAPTVRGIFIDSLAQPFRQGKGVETYHINFFHLLYNLSPAFYKGKTDMQKKISIADTGSLQIRHPIPGLGFLH